MGKVQRYKKGLSGFISSDKGQRFFNFAYSIGAAIVIWGALFKILHLPGGNFLLSLGMGTEVLMFILTAFDRPPKEYKWEEVFPVLDTKDPEDRPEFGSGSGIVIAGGSTSQVQNSPSSATGMMQAPPADLAQASQQYFEQMSAMIAELQHLRETTAALNNVSDTLLESYQAITQHSAEITSSANGYVQQMQALSHNLGGLNTIYEIQLKSVSSQIDAIDRVNKGIKEIRDMYERSASQSTRYCEETERMAMYMQQLNSVYERMINAMTINMYNPMMAQATGQQPAPQAPATPHTAEPAETEQ